MNKKYDFNEFGYGAQSPMPPQFDFSAFIIALLVAAGISLAVLIK